MSAFVQVTKINFNLSNNFFLVTTKQGETKLRLELMCERVGKIIARTLCAMHHGILNLYYIFNNDAYCLDFRAQKFPLTFSSPEPKAPVGGGGGGL